MSGCMGCSEPERCGVHRGEPCPGWIDPKAWERPPAADAVRLDVVFDDQLGVIANATAPNGETFTAAEAPRQRLCPDCNGSGYASTIDGRTLGTCSTCDGDGAPMSDDEWECRCGQRTASDADTIRDHIADAHAPAAGHRLGYDADRAEES